jgi:hypothetical protein
MHNYIWVKNRLKKLYRWTIYSYQINMKFSMHNMWEDDEKSNFIKVKIHKK